MKLGHEQAKEIGRIIARFQQSELSIQETASLVQCQFDRAMLIAMKEGAVRAAATVGSQTYPKHIQRQELERAYDDGASDKRRAILIAAQQWTEKDL